VSEVIHGTARLGLQIPQDFPLLMAERMVILFPVPLKVYDETIATLQTAVAKAKMGNTDKTEAIKKLHAICCTCRKGFYGNLTPISMLD
jgi:hypothetical protein